MTVLSLKIIAVVTMVIDHFGVAFVNDYDIYLICRYIGRLAFPIFAFLVGQALLKTRDQGGYIKRILIATIVSEPFFDYMWHGTFFDFESQSIMLTLFLGALAVYVFDTLKEKGVNVIIAIVPMLYLPYLGERLSCDYGFSGVVLVIAFYLVNRYDLRNKWLFYVVGMIFVTIAIDSTIQIASVVSVIFLALYNGNLGYKRDSNLKWVFYSIYPLHLLLFGLIDRFVILAN